MTTLPMTTASLIETGSELECTPIFPPAGPLPAGLLATWGRLMMWAAREIERKPVDAPSVSRQVDTYSLGRSARDLGQAFEHLPEDIRAHFLAGSPQMGFRLIQERME